MENPNLAGGFDRAPSESTPKTEACNAFAAQPGTEQPPVQTEQPPVFADFTASPAGSAAAFAANPAGTAPGAPASYAAAFPANGANDSPAFSSVPAFAAASPGLFGAPALGTPAQPEKPKILSDKKDALFALLFFAVGYLYIHWFLFGYYDFAPFTVFYAAAVLAYIYVRGKRPPAESWFWLVVALCLGGPLYLFPDIYGDGLLGRDNQPFLLMFVAAYWTLCACGALSEGKTSNWVVLDAANAIFFVPFGNFFRQVSALARGARGTVTGRRALYIALGLLLALPLLGLVLPSLMDADYRFRAWLWDVLDNFSFTITLFKIVLSLPVSAFLFGLCFGGLYKRHTELIPRGTCLKLGKILHFAPDLAVTTALGVVCAMYLIFIVFQSGYLFSAFSGRLPEDFTFAEYAREGFFELCRVCSLNVAFLLGANLLSKTPRADNKALRSLNLIVSALTLLLIATAGSKMGLYIAAYGLTPLRVLVSIFLVWLAIVFLLVMVWQFKPIQPVRAAVLTGAVLVALMCALPVMPGIDAYNAAYAPATAEALATDSYWMD